MYIFLFVLIVILDQVSKFVVLLYKNGAVNLVFNNGIAFGFGHGNPTLLMSSLIISMYVSLVYYTYQCYQQNQNILGEICILAGGFSNILDRYQHGAVVDFINIFFAVCNIADIFVVGGALFIIVKLLKPS